VRLSVEAFGRTIVLIYEKDAPTEQAGDVHDHTAATVEVANGWRDDYAVDCFGFGRRTT
jgi:hypothetical protein